MADLPAPWEWDGDAAVVVCRPGVSGYRVEVCDDGVESDVEVTYQSRWPDERSPITLYIDVSVIRAVLARYDARGGRRG